MEDHDITKLHIYFINFALINEHLNAKKLLFQLYHQMLLIIINNHLKGVLLYQLINILLIMLFINLMLQLLLSLYLKVINNVFNI